MKTYALRETLRTPVQDTFSSARLRHMDRWESL